MAPSDGPRISIANVIAEAFWHPWVRRRAFLKGLFLPALAILAVQVGLWGEGVPAGRDGWLVWGVWALLWILFAVTCHRLVLLGQEADEVPLVPGWGWRETRFLGCFLLMTAVTWGAVFAVLMPLGMVAGMLSPDGFQASQPYISGIIGIYFFARIGPVLPAAAIGAPVDFRETWRKTRGNTWRLMVIVGILPWIFGWISGLLIGSDPGLLRSIAGTLIWTVFLMIEVAALSVSYRRLNESPSSPPRANGP